MLPPDTINPGTDPLVDRGSVSPPYKSKPEAALVHRARSGCYLALLSFLVMLVVGGCSLLARGLWLMSDYIAELPPLARIDGEYIALTLFFGLLLLLAFIVGFVLPPWRKPR